MSDVITSSQQENRLFPPPPGFSAHARIKSRAEYDKLYRESIDSPNTFWDRIARDLHWMKPWSKVLEWPGGDHPYAKWFVGAQTNLAYNCLERQIHRGLGDKTAIIFEGEPLSTSGTPDKSAGKPEVQTYTYKQLLAKVSQLANALKAQGVKKGDRVTVYMPMIPEAAMAMLACARIGAVHSVVFGGFSSQAIADRVEDAQSDFLITADGGYRRGTTVNLKDVVDDALTKTARIKKTIVFKRTGQPVKMTEGRDLWWHDVVDSQSPSCPAEPMDSEDPLFVLYTSGSTGKPKGILHTTAGYMVGTYLTFRDTFDVRDEDIYFCTADIGWITGHSYVVYGPLNNGTTVFMYEGAPNFPDFSRLWDIIQRHKITLFYTAPTAIRAFMRAGREFVDKHDLSSLRLLGSVGEPINPEAWMWYHDVIGHGKCPIVDTWWQTETGGFMITPLPGATPLKPGTATLPFFGVDAAVVDKEGRELGPNQGGMLVIRKPWPSMLRGVFNDPERYVKQYWSDVKAPDGSGAYYFTGDGARRDENGYFWIMGRIDDVLNVSGHRLGTAEIESALVSHDAVAEAACVPMPHELKGQALAAFVTLRNGVKPDEALKKQLSDKVAKQIGSFARPDQIRFTEALPKTRSGKIMRRLLKEIASGKEIKGDTTTLEDFSILAKLKENDEA